MSREEFRSLLTYFCRVILDESPDEAEFQSSLRDDFFLDELSLIELEQSLTARFELSQVERDGLSAVFEKDQLSCESLYEHLVRHVAKFAGWVALVEREGARRYDVMFWGATGLSGRNSLREFLKFPAAKLIRVCIAGRSKSSLESLRHKLGENVFIEIANADDEASMRRIVAKTRLLISTVGPFAVYGPLSLSSCIATRTHYMDISGEISWIHQMIEQFGAYAEKAQVCVIHSVGFDCCPSDLLALRAVRSLEQKFGKDIHIRLHCYAAMLGVPTAGTLKSIAETRSHFDPKFRDPFILGGEKSDDFDAEDVKKFYRVEPEGFWTGPSWFSPLDARIVRRSADIARKSGNGYGQSFQYNESGLFESEETGRKEQRALMLAMEDRTLATTTDLPAQFYLVPRCDKGGLPPLRLRTTGERATCGAVALTALHVVLSQPDIRGSVTTPTALFGEQLMEEMVNKGFFSLH